MNKSTLTVQGRAITVIGTPDNDYISLTDMVQGFGDETILYNWMRNRNTVEFLGIWETLYNPDFNPIEFERFKLEAGLNKFNLSPKKWVEATGAIGIFSKAGRYGGGTFGHKDIAFEFGSWLSSEFKLYLIKEFQRLKDSENDPQTLRWNFQRLLSKVNHQIHTDAIRDNLIPPLVDRIRMNQIYASESDLLNMALFGMTAKEWRKRSNQKSGSQRDEATLEQLVVLSNLESINAMLIHQGLSASERLVRLNNIAISQMKSLVSNRKTKAMQALGTLQLGTGTSKTNAGAASETALDAIDGTT